MCVETYTAARIGCGSIAPPVTGACCTFTAPAQIVAVACPTAPAMAPSSIGPQVVCQPTMALPAQIAGTWIAAPGWALEAMQPVNLAGLRLGEAARTLEPSAVAPNVWAAMPAAAAMAMPPSTPWKKQSAQNAPGTPQTSSTDAPLTRGARRRLQQRLRKKLGKLERSRAVAGLPPLEPEEELEAVMRPRKEVDVQAAKKPCSADVEVHELPIFVIDQAAQEEKFDLLVPDLKIGGNSAEKIVPVCAFQKDTRLPENSELDELELFVALPCQRKAMSAPAKMGAEAEQSEEEAKSVASDSMSTVSSWASDARVKRSATASWPMQPGAPIPIANTFVHFAEKSEGARRRSLSV